MYAEPHDTQDYADTAAGLGYGSDLGRMNRDHELMHTLLAMWLGRPESPVLRAVANECWQHDPDGLLAMEEAACLALQRLAVAWGVDLLDLTEAEK